MIRLIDGRVQQAVCIIRGKTDHRLYRDLGEIYCYSPEDIEKAKSVMVGDYQLEQIEQVNLDVTKDKVYICLEEAKEHIAGNKLPAIMEIPILKERLSNAEDWIVATLHRLQKVEADIIKNDDGGISEIER